MIRESKSIFSLGLFLSLSLKISNSLPPPWLQLTLIHKRHKKLFMINLPTFKKEKRERKEKN